MREFSRPIIYSSRCLGFDECRWNGVSINFDLNRKLKPYVDFIHHCPEFEIGLGAPRDPVRLVKQNDEIRVIQLKTDIDVTDDENNFADEVLDSITDVDGFILKSKSPSCGTRDVKVYKTTEPGPPIMRSPGIFGKAVHDKFPGAAIEEEARLTNFSIRERFLTRVFANAEFRKVKESNDINELIRFHTNNKLLYMAYDKDKLTEMGRIVANHENSFLDVIAEYELLFQKIFKRPARYTAIINVLNRANNGLKDELDEDEIEYFNQLIEQYRYERIPLSAILTVLKSWIVRFNNSYLSDQTFFEPYPLGLVEITDSGKGRKQ